MVTATLSRTAEPTEVATSSWPRRMLATAVAIAAAMLVVPSVALAHVTVQPESVEGGSFAVVAFRVPNERDNASTTKVRVLLPEEQPVGSVRTTPVPGWEIATKTRTLDEPIDMFGEELSEVVSEVTWTATGKGVAPGQFQDFDVSMGPLPESGEMVFSAVQIYSNGEKVSWNEVAVDDAVEPEHPAPVLTIHPAGEDSSGTAGDQSADTAAVARSSDEGFGSTLSMALSVVAVLVSIGALLLAGRKAAA